MDPKRARQASLLALLQRHQGGTVSRRTITSSIEGYAGNDEAVRKMLQRDLADLQRTCDLVVEYVSLRGDQGYRIRRRPLELALDAQDLTVLAFVARALGPEDRALLHLEALGAPVDQAPGGVAAPLEAHPALPLLLEAIDERREVRFAYLKPGDASPTERAVLPWVLVHRGGWYLIGFCLTRNAERRFKLARIVDGPHLGDVASYEIPKAIAGIVEPWAIADDALAPTIDRLVARIAVDAGQARAIARRLRGTLLDASGDERPIVEVEHGDEQAFAGFLAGYGADVEVLEPASLRAAVRDRLDAILAATKADA